MVTARRDQPQRTQPPSGSAWLSAHLFHHGDLDRLLTGLVAPLAEELLVGGLVRDWFYLRYWDGGPHVRLRLLTPSGSRSERLRTEVARRADAYFAAQPSRTVLTEETYRATAHRLALREHVEEYSTSMYPNDSVRWISYRPEVHRYGTGASLRAVERHFSSSSRICLELLGAAGATAPRRLTACFTAVALAWLCADPERDALRQWLRHRSLRTVQGADERDLAQRYERQREPLSTLMRHLITQASGAGAETEPLLVPWWSSLQRLREELLAVARTAPDTLPRWERTVGETPAQRTLLPVLDLCAHLFCNRLGVAPRDEQYARYLAARALAAADTKEAAR